MDLLDFNGEEMYFDEPVDPEVEQLLLSASRMYGAEAAELHLLQAYFLQPGHLTVLVALYRYFYYQQRYAEALIVADRAIAIAAERLDLPPRWQDLSESDLGGSVLVSMTLTRFLLLALKGSGYLLMRMGEAAAALERFEKIVEVDTSDRLGVNDLLQIARSAVTQSTIERSGANVSYLHRHGT